MHEPVCVHTCTHRPVYTCTHRHTEIFFPFPVGMISSCRLPAPIFYSLCCHSRGRRLFNIFSLSVPLSWPLPSNTEASQRLPPAHHVDTLGCGSAHSARCTPCLGPAETLCEFAMPSYNYHCPLKLISMYMFPPIVMDFQEFLLKRRWSFLFFSLLCFGLFLRKRGTEDLSFGLLFLEFSQKA